MGIIERAWGMHSSIGIAVGVDIGGVGVGIRVGLSKALVARLGAGGTDARGRKGRGERETGSRLGARRGRGGVVLGGG